MNRALGRIRLLCGMAAIVTIVASVPTSLTAQGYRGELRLGGSYLELQTLIRDSLPESQVPGEGTRRRLPNGTVVSCVPGGYCHWYRSNNVESILVSNQDLVLTGWGGMTGLSGHLHLIGRYGTDNFWPLSGQKFAVSAAYLSLDRQAYRIRAGRLFRSDGLGYYNFDGASAMWRGLRSLWIEAYGGRSLLLGANQPVNGSLLEAVDSFAPDAPGLVFGAELGVRAGSIFSGSVMYQRVIRDDWAALYSERATLDARALLGQTILDLAAEYDIAYAEFNEARLRLTTPLPANFEIMAEARHYTPFFQLWTIWSAFSPVGFNEARGSLAWSEPRSGLRLELGGGYRNYEDTSSGVTFAPLRTDGWRLFGTAGWTGGSWFANGSYRAEAGFGASRFGGDAVFGRRFSRDAYVALRGQATQTFGEFRLNEQVVAGGGIDGSYRIGDLSLTGGAGIYNVNNRERPSEGNWTQPRLYLSAGYRFGMEPRARSPMPASSGGDQ